MNTSPTLAFDRVVRSPLFWFLVTFAFTAAIIVVRFVAIGTASIEQSAAINLFLDFLLGVLVSFIFYFLIVHLPERRRQTSLRRQMLSNYLYLKRSLVQQVVHGSILAGRKDLDSSIDLVDRLLDINEFRKTFEGGREANEGYYAFSNHLGDDSPQFQEIMLRLTQLKTQVGYLLNHYQFDDDELFDFFKLLEMRLLRLERAKPGYDESETLLEFLYEICSGWSSIDGYTGGDPILRRIQRL